MVALLLFPFIAFSQSKSVSKIKFGINAGVNYANLSPDGLLPTNAELSNGVGFSLGILMDYSITGKLSISPKSEIAFFNSSIESVGAARPDLPYNVFSATVNLMTHLVYKMGNGNSGPYLLAGPNFKIPISERPELSSSFYTNSDFAIDFGIGLENSLPKFIFAPELRYSFGLGNVNQNPTLNPLNFHNVTLVLNFK